MKQYSFERRESIRVAYPYSWMTIEPHLQHTACGDGLLGNEFDSLVDVGGDKMVVSNAATSWDIENNFKKYTFKIDTKRRYSNGEYLSAQHFKDSWEYSLKNGSKSHNMGSLDGLYQLQGFDDFSKTGQISGIEVVDNETLVLHYATPFRQALDHFSSSRFAVFLVKDAKYFGTGRYIINEEIREKKVHLVPNPYHSEYKKLKDVYVEVMNRDDSIRKLVNNEIDVIDFVDINDDPCEKNAESIGCSFGQESAHLDVTLNALSGRFFAKKEYRLALQFLIYQYFTNKDHEKIKKYLKNIGYDPQVYLPLQKGRIDETEVKELIALGEPYVKEMIEATAKNPLKLVCGYSVGWVKDVLVECGLKFTPDSGKMEWNKILNIIYKTSDVDIYLGKSNVVSSDPDGLYHLLGKNGAILLPMSYRESVADLLEEGRTITDQDKMHEHYKKVSKEMLKEVPFIHLGFLKDIVMYNKKTIKLKEIVRDRHYHKLQNYELL